MAYIVTYIIPFMVTSPCDRGDVLSILLLFGVVGYLYVNSNMIYINPLLRILGYSIYELTNKDGKVSALISRRSYIAPAKSISVVSMGNYVLLEKE